MVADHIERLRAERGEFEKKLSPSAYAYKQIKNLVINFGSLFGGAYVGVKVGERLWGDALVSPASAQRLTRYFGNLGTVLADRLQAKNVLGFAVGGASYMGALITLGYEHWAKKEAERLSVDEINRDISEAKLRMDPELVRENNLLREMLKKQDSQLQTLQDMPRNAISSAGAALEPLATGPRREVR